MTYKIENCPKCGGTHYGSHKCPFSAEDIAKMGICILCANGNDLSEGQNCAGCGRAGVPLHPDMPKDLSDGLPHLNRNE